MQIYDSSSPITSQKMHMSPHQRLPRKRIPSRSLCLTHSGQTPTPHLYDTRQAFAITWNEVYAHLIQLLVDSWIMDQLICDVHFLRAGGTRSKGTAGRTINDRGTRCLANKVNGRVPSLAVHLARIIMLTNKHVTRLSQSQKNQTIRVRALISLTE